MGTERVGRFFFFPVGFHFKDSKGISLSLSRLLQHTREWMKQLSHLNTHSGNPPLSTMPGQNRKSINTYNAFYLFSNSSPFTRSATCEAESEGMCHWWLFMIWQLLRGKTWKVVRYHWVGGLKMLKWQNLSFRMTDAVEWLASSSPLEEEDMWETPQVPPCPLPSLLQGWFLKDMASTSPPMGIISGSACQPLEVWEEA